MIERYRSRPWRKRDVVPILLFIPAFAYCFLFLHGVWAFNTGRPYLLTRWLEKEAGQ